MAYQALKKKMILPGGSGYLDLGYYFLTHACVQRDQFHKWLLLASCFNRYFMSLVANKKLALYSARLYVEQKVCANR